MLTYQHLNDNLNPDLLYAFSAWFGGQMSLDEDSKNLLARRLEIGAPYFQDMTPEGARTAMAEGRKAANITPPEMATTRYIASGVDGCPMDMRLYIPKGAEAAQGQLSPFMVFFHGGGFVVGDLDTHDILCRNLSIASGIPILAVDYRLAPEHKFPAAIDDGKVAVNWIAQNAMSLGLDKDRMAVGGDSAGGNIATMMCHLARDGAVEASFVYQLLAYPWVDMTMAQNSYGVSADGLPVTYDAMAWFRDLYLNSDAEQVDWRASPLMAPDMKDLPPACILTAGFDPLCDEGLAYGRRLEQGGVPVHALHYPGQIHGFLTLGAQLPTAGKAIDALGTALKAGLAV